MTKEVGVLKIKDASGKVVGVLTDEDNEPEMKDDKNKKSKDAEQSEEQTEEGEE